LANPEAWAQFDLDVMDAGALGGGEGGDIFMRITDIILKRLRHPRAGLDDCVLYDLKWAEMSVKTLGHILRSSFAAYLQLGQQGGNALLQTFLRIGWGRLRFFNMDHVGKTLWMAVIVGHTTALRAFSSTDEVFSHHSENINSLFSFI
jgi:hypothetical protein